MAAQLRFCIGGVSTESNGFVSHIADEAFVRTTGYIKSGVDVLSLADVSSELGGAILYLRRNAPDAELVPTVALRANSGGPLEAGLWSRLRDELVARVQAAVNEAALSGVILAMHGAMSVGPAGSAECDPEGALAAAVRAVIGPDAVMIMTLDLHANVTAQMTSSCDGIVSYDHYPHDDIVRTGERGAALMLKAARREVRLGMATAKLGMLQTAFHCKTDLGEAEGIGAAMLRRAKGLEHGAVGREVRLVDGSGSKVAQTIYDDTGP